MSKNQNQNQQQTKKPDQPTTGGIQGEGNYKAAETYNKATKKFVESGKVEQAARNAEPRDQQEAEELKSAEAEGLSRAREEDPEVTQPHATPASTPKV